jgi:predicted amidophosphoribosyltransferase
MTTPCVLDLEWHARYWGGEPAGVACGEPSFATVSLACVHEHVDRPRVCWGCAADMQQAKGMLTCPRCWNGPESHKCLCLVVIDWDSGEKTVVQEPGREMMTP